MGVGGWVGVWVGVRVGVGVKVRKGAAVCLRDLNFLCNDSIVQYLS